MTISPVGCGLGRGALVVSTLVDGVVVRFDETVVVRRGLNDVVCFCFIVPVVGIVVLSFKGLTVVTTVGGRVVTLTLFIIGVVAGLDVCVAFNFDVTLIGAVVGFTVTPTDGFGCFELTFNGLFVIETLFTVVVGIRFVVLGNIVVDFVIVCVAFFK